MGVEFSVEKEYEKYCRSFGLDFSLDESVRPYDKTTLFCPAGMQQYKKQFSSDCTGTISNIQTCIRLKDLDEIGDGTHYLSFGMMGLFSFREWSLKRAIDFWMGFLCDTLGLEIDYVTIHPDRMSDWKGLYSEYPVEIRADEECVWTDGEIGGYCTEFFKNDIEVGNIVNPLETCIDAGFGLERIQSFFTDLNPPSKQEILIDACSKILLSGFYPGNKEQGYILRKLLRELYKMGAEWDNEHFLKEKERQDRVIVKYYKNKDKDSLKGKTKEWWFDTMGVDIDFVESLSDEEVNAILLRRQQG
jgi:alanyl-tRNA synthetase